VQASRSDCALGSITSGPTVNAAGSPRRTTGEGKRRSPRGRSHTVPSSAANATASTSMSQFGRTGPEVPISVDGVIQDDLRDLMFGFIS